MDCRSIRAALVQQAASGREDPEVARHLADCPACAREARRCAAARDAVRALPVLPFSAEVAAACREAAAGARRRAPDRHPPATPGPAAGSLVRALAAAGAAALIVLALSAGIFLAPSRQVRPPSAGRLMRAAGEVRFRLPGMLQGASVEPGMDLLQGTVLEAGPDGVVGIATPGGRFHLGGASAVRLTGEREAELLYGWCMADADAGAVGPLEISAGGAAAACEGGQMVVRGSSRRLVVRCLAGRVRLGGQGGGRTLDAGGQALLAGGTVIEPVRSAGARTLEHWLRERDLVAAGLAPPTGAPLLPLPEGASLPVAVRVRRLQARLVTSGPLYVVLLAVELANTGAQQWRGRLDPAQVLWPAPLAVVRTGDLDLPAGATREARCAAVGAMDAWGEQFVWALTPAGWTNTAIEGFEAAVAASAAGGVRSVRADGYPAAWQPAGTGLTGRLSRRGAVPQMPLRLSFSFARTQGVDAVSLPAGVEGAQVTLTAVRGLFDPRQEVIRARRLLMAFDARASYGPLDRLYAHETAEGLAAAVRAGSELPLMVYDGQYRVLPPGAGAQTDGVLCALWGVDQVAAGAEGGLLRAVAGIRSEQPVLAFLLVGADDPPKPEATDGTNAGADAPRPYVIQIGRAEPSAAYRIEAAQLGGWAIAEHGALSPEAVAARAIANLPWPGLSKLEFAADPLCPPCRVLTPGGIGSNAAVLLVTHGGGPAGTLNVATADATASRRIETGAGEAVSPGTDLDGELGRALAGNP